MPNEFRNAPRTARSFFAFVVTVIETEADFVIAEFQIGDRPVLLSISVSRDMILYLDEALQIWDKAAGRIVELSLEE